MTRRHIPSSFEGLASLGHLRMTAIYRTTSAFASTELRIVCKTTQ